ncbi:MAG: 4-hydroxy-tetrahydrodipicolinate synthase [Deltaproteobacteria bacterium]|nr:4-hydroxy-tetrahydrodipicolinate synthase [Deltaproteobacteria bacterium]
MQLRGAMTALVTPMKDGGVDVPALGRLVDMQIEAGIDALVAVGTTGESATLSNDEHIQVVAETVKAAAGRVPVIAGAGSNDTARAVASSKACADAGANGLLQVVPYYNKPTQTGLIHHFETIADATELPVILYNVPGRTVTDMSAETVAELSRHQRIVGVKEATADMTRASKILELTDGQFAVLSGDDFTAFPLYALGGHGVISVVSNVMPAAMAEMWDAAAGGDWGRARALHFKIQPLAELLFAEPNPVPAKACLEMLGVMGTELRSPLLPASEQLRNRLRLQLGKDGLL